MVERHARPFLFVRKGPYVVWVGQQVQPEFLGSTLGYRIPFVRFELHIYEWHRERSYEQVARTVTSWFVHMLK
jgi:hypothetical protein